MRLTTKQLRDAIDKNGYRKANGTFIRIKSEYKKMYSSHQLEEFARGAALPHNKEHIASACALGQAGLNLDIIPQKIIMDQPYLANRIMAWNDGNLTLGNRPESLKEIVKRFDESRF